MITMDSLFWADQVAKKVVEKWKEPLYRAEMGMGASGIPHIGSVGDGVRSYVVSLGIRSLGKKSLLIAYSDDMDGLRKVPSGFPPSLEREIGKPVSMIPDPFGCHKSFALHMSSLLEDAFRKLGIEFILKRSDEEYRKGSLDREIIRILENWKKAGRIIKKVTGSEKFLRQLPFLPVCKSCGRVYTTRAYRFENRKILYTCDQQFEGKSGMKKIIIKGCGACGEAGIREGKLAWKVEFAARWKALGIHYEAFGKDILESVMCNDAICREILEREPPVHSFYEMFTERGGAKLSKSKGNVFTPQDWLKYASPETLRLLFLKRLGTARVVDLETIPFLMDELDELERVYFGESSVPNKKMLAHKKRLFEYVHFLEPPDKPGVKINYRTIANLALSLPLKGREPIIKKILLESGKPGKLDAAKSKELDKRILYASRWAAAETFTPRKMPPLGRKEKKALRQLSEALKSPLKAEEIQEKIFEIAKERGLKPREFFQLLYRIILGLDKGPRAGRLIELVGRERARKLLDKI
jgi:lysyl-tRNA synthetase class 1